MSFADEIEEMQERLNLAREFLSFDSAPYDANFSFDKAPRAIDVMEMYNDDEGYDHEDYQEDDSIPEPPELASK